MTMHASVSSACFRSCCGSPAALVILFLIAPIVAIVPLSFNAEPFFTYPMPGLSLRWYRRVLRLRRLAAGAEEQHHRRGLRHDPVDRARHAGGDRPDPAGLPGARDDHRDPDLADDRAGDRLGGRRLLLPSPRSACSTR